MATLTSLVDKAPKKPEHAAQDDAWATTATAFNYDGFTTVGKPSVPLYARLEPRPSCGYTHALLEPPHINVTTKSTAFIGSFGDVAPSLSEHPGVRRKVAQEASRKKALADVELAAETKRQQDATRDEALQAAEAKLEEAMQQIQRQEKECDRLAQRLRDNKTAARRVSADLAAAEKTAGKLKKSNEGLRRRVKRRERALDELTGRVDRRRSTWLALRGYMDTAHARGSLSFEEAASAHYHMQSMNALLV
jgi:hypothetical protein